MASLEDYLRNFATAGSGFAAPSARWVSFTPVVDTGNEAWGHETAPSVGLFVIKFANANIGYWDIQNQTSHANTCGPSLGQHTGASYVPCNKGDAITYHLGSTSGQTPNASAVEVYFVPSLGSQ